MFNRSLLRSRVFHRLYALKIVLDGTEASFLDKISEELIYDEESGEKLDKEDHKKAYKKEEKVFLELVKLDGIGKKKDESPLAAGFFKEYKGQLREETKRARKNLIESTEAIQLAYFTILNFLAEFGEFGTKLEKEKEGSMPKGPKKSDPYRNLKSNLYFKFLVSHKPFTEKGTVNWEKEDDCLRSVFLDSIKHDEEFQNYLKIVKPKKGQDKDIVLHLISERIFKNQVFNTLFEDRFITWFQEKNVVRSMVRKFIKDLDPQKQEFEHISLTSNWEEDKQFFLNLWDVSLEEWNENDEFLSGLAKNWDPERIALTDKTLIIMGMSELVHFPSIPIKVTINEYIELSKKYSTPKSKSFVNGVLDKVSGKWVKSGKIKKSGRGLIDNK
jgi:transcription antitermination protein NusB